MFPQLGCGGWMPKPRNDSPLSRRIALPTPSVVATMAGPSALGSAWRQRTRYGRAPSAVAASTYGCTRTPSTSPRTSRATPIQPVAMSTTTTVVRPGRQRAAHTRRSTSLGIARSASAIAIENRSMRPPRHAAAAPMSVPMPLANADPTTPTARLRRPASIMRTNKSRPNLSVPRI